MVDGHLHGGRRVALGLATDDDYRVYVSDGGRSRGSSTGTPTPQAWEPSGQKVSVGSLPTATLVCIRHSEDGDILHHALRVLDVTSGATVADLADPGNTLTPIAWSPTGHTLAFVSELGSFERPGLWDLDTGARRDLALSDLPGAVFPVTWYDEGDALLVRHEHAGTAQLFKVDTVSEAHELIADPDGDIDDAAIRPDGTVWLKACDAAHPPTIVDTAGEVVARESGRARSRRHGAAIALVREPERRSDPRLRRAPDG